MALSVRVRRPGHEANRSPSSDGKVKNERSYTSSFPYAFVVYTVTLLHCCVQNLVYPRYLFKNVIIRSLKAIILPAVLYWCEMLSSFTQGSSYVSGNRAVRRMRGRNREGGTNSMILKIWVLLARSLSAATSHGSARYMFMLWV